MEVIPVIIQARMGSKRLPGKSLMMISNKYILDHVIESLRKLGDQFPLIIVTSKNERDNPISQYCLSKGIKCSRGSENNVAERFLNELKEWDTEYFFRICADSPLLDYRILSSALIYNYESYDIITTIPSKTFPSGMNVELVRKNIFVENYKLFNKEEHFEHVTKYFYQNADNFKIFSSSSNIEYCERFKFSLDTQEDFEKITLFFNSLVKPHYEYTLEEKCQIYRSLFINE